MHFLFGLIFVFVGQASAQLVSKRWNDLFKMSMQTQNRLHEIHEEIRGIELDSKRWDRDITHFGNKVDACEKAASTHSCKKDIEQWRKNLNEAQEEFGKYAMKIKTLEDEYNDKVRAEHARIDKEAAATPAPAPAPVEERTVPPYQADRTHVDTVALTNQVRNDANDLGDKLQAAENKLDDFEDRLDQAELGLYVKAKLERMLKDGQMCDKVVKQCVSGVTPSESSIKSFMDSVFKTKESVRSYPVSSNSGAK